MNVGHHALGELGGGVDAFDRAHPIVQAGGESNIYIGKIDLNYENRNGKWVLMSQQGELIPITDKVPMDPEIKRIVDQYLANVSKPAA